MTVVRAITDREKALLEALAVETDPDAVERTVRERYKLDIWQYGELWDWVRARRLIDTKTFRSEAVITAKGRQVLASGEIDG